jgi:hypothetical protein
MTTNPSPLLRDVGSNEQQPETTTKRDDTTKRNNMTKRSNTTMRSNTTKKGGTDDDEEVREMT